MKLISFYTSDYEKIASINKPRWQLYSNIHKNIKFECFGLPQIGTRNDFCWDKIELCRNVIEEVDDYLCWVDIDIMLLDFKKSIYDFITTDKNITVSSDDNGICTGLFILKKTEWSIKFLDAMIFLKNITPKLEEQLITVGAGDQSCLKYMMGFINILDNMCIIKDDGTISHPNTNIFPHTFAYHFWSNGGEENRNLVYEKMIKIKTDYPLPSI